LVEKGCRKKPQGRERNVAEKRKRRGGRKRQVEKKARGKRKKKGFKTESRGSGSDRHFTDKQSDTLQTIKKAKMGRMKKWAAQNCVRKKLVGGKS